MQSNIIVNETCSTIRYLGRQALKDRWVTACVAVLIYSACMQIPPIFINAIFGSSSDMVNLFSDQMGSDTSQLLMSTVEGTTYNSIFSAIYTLLVTGPFSFGISFFFINLVRRGPTDYGQIFSGFSYFGKTLGLSLLIALIAAAFTLPGIFLFFFGISLGNFMLGFLGILALALVIIPALMFSMCFYILVDNPQIGATQALGASRNMMRGNMAKLFLLYLSFIGWLVVAGLADGAITSLFAFSNIYIITAIGGFIGQAGMFVVTAYMTAAEVQFYDLLTGRLRLSNPSYLSGGYGYGS